MPNVQIPMDELNTSLREILIWVTRVCGGEWRAYRGEVFSSVIEQTTGFNFSYNWLDRNAGDDELLQTEFRRRLEIERPDHARGWIYPVIGDDGQSDLSEGEIRELGRIRLEQLIGGEWRLSEDQLRYDHVGSDIVFDVGWVGRSNDDQIADEFRSLRDGGSIVPLESIILTGSQSRMDVLDAVFGGHWDWRRPNYVHDSGYRLTQMQGREFVSHLRNGDFDRIRETQLTIVRGIDRERHRGSTSDILRTLTEQRNSPLPADPIPADEVRATGDILDMQAWLTDQFTGDWEYIRRLDNMRRSQDCVMLGWQTISHTTVRELQAMINAQIGGGTIMPRRAMNTRRAGRARPQISKKPKAIMMKYFEPCDTDCNYSGVTYREFNWVQKGVIAYSLIGCDDARWYVTFAVFDNNRVETAESILPRWAFAHTFSSQKKAYGHVNKVRKYLDDQGIQGVIGLRTTGATDTHVTTISGRPLHTYTTYTETS